VLYESERAREQERKRRKREIINKRNELNGLNISLKTRERERDGERKGGRKNSKTFFLRVKQIYDYSVD